MNETIEEVANRFYMALKPMTLVERNKVLSLAFDQLLKDEIYKIQELECKAKEVEAELVESRARIDNFKNTINKLS